MKVLGKVLEKEIWKTCRKKCKNSKTKVKNWSRVFSPGGGNENTGGEKYLFFPSAYLEFFWEGKKINPTIAMSGAQKILQAA